jgi:hypothetical protein
MKLQKLLVLIVALSLVVALSACERKTSAFAGTKTTALPPGSPEYSVKPNLNQSPAKP